MFRDRLSLSRKERLSGSSQSSRSGASELSPQEETKTLIFRTPPRFSTGAEPKSASSTGQPRSPSPCAWIPTSSHGSKRMAAVIRPKRIGFYDMPCFTTPDRRVGPIASSGVARPDIRKERLDSHSHRLNLLLGATKTWRPRWFTKRWIVSNGRPEFRQNRAGGDADEI
jgi:hypothetical protein